MNALNKLLKIASICSSISYNIIKYKLKLSTFNNTVITICNSLVNKNYMFTKVIQWGIQEIHNESNIKDNDELKNYFKSFSSNVPYVAYDLEHSMSILKNTISYAKNNNDDLVIENDHVPINSGTVALVFKAKLNNAPVIIKILRYNIKNRIQEDMDDLLLFFNNFFIKKFIQRYIKINLKNFINNNCDIILKQCDFNHEAENALIFESNLKNKSNIVIPHIYKHYTEVLNEVLVMDYLDGRIAKNVPIEEFKTYAVTLQTFFFESLFMYNVLHGDFHLGNIIIMNDGNNIGIIDFGIVYTLTEKTSNDLFNVLFLSINSKFDQLLKIVINMICLNKNEHETILKILKNDEEFMKLKNVGNFTANIIITCVNRIMSFDNIKLDTNICNLFLCSMSGLQTIEHVNDDKSLEFLIKTYIQRSIKI
jgi:predicted unusual protein kinase regulating ubiquinone biosynthesis (AarF/ABC1/UbiB family)